MPTLLFRNNLIWIFISSIAILLSGCYSTEPFYSKQYQSWEEAMPPESDPIHSLYVIGDAGKPKVDTIDPTLSLLSDMISDEHPDSTAVVFLGDNIYPEGLRKTIDGLNKEDEAHLKVQLNSIRHFEGRKVFIPGNHDWAKGGKKGLENVKRQDKYIDSFFDKNVFRPDNGCPGPETFKLGKDAVLIVIDTQWWFQKHKRSEGEKDGCDVNDESDFIHLLEDALRRNRNKKIIVAGHHPLYSNGNHGGYFTFKDHLFPLTAFSHNAYVPLPVLGSIYPLYRKIFGDIQDIPHVEYENLRGLLLDMFSEYPDLIYLAGHEHNLQYHEVDALHHVLSGSGSKTSYVRHNNKVGFAHTGTGFCVVRLYDGGESWVEYYVPGLGDENHLLFRTQLSEVSKPIITDTEIEPVSYAGISKSVIPEPSYKAGPLKKLFLGRQHRDVWTAEIQVSLLDIHKDHGGLTPMKKGGGMQTQSLRLEGGDGHQYVVRSIQKDPSSTIPKKLRRTVANSILHDGISASHPYAALVVPPMADAVGVFHTNPQLVIMPDDKILGEYQNEFAGLLCLYEERPEGDQSHQASFGNSEEVVGSGDLIYNMSHDHKHKVDQRSMLRARLLDKLIADWDRHDDQWRWASFEQGKKTVYKPIPRDRDQVFFQQDGLIPNISNRKWMIRKLQSFKPNIRDIAGQNFNARYVDRSYLTELDLEDWKQIADSMRSQLTDDILLTGMKQMPAPGFEVSGNELFDILKIRRDKLTQFAEEYYEVLSIEVDVVGSHKDEFFEVIRLDDERTQVNVYPRKKGKPERKKPLYQRTFLRSETKEIRLYGLDGNDEYHVSGDVKKGILVRIIGGTDKDKIVAKSSVRGLRKKTLIYDTIEKKKKKRNKIKSGPESHEKLAKKSQALTYDREEFKYDAVAPLAWFGFNPDDGVFLGGGAKFTKQGFKKSPYRSEHIIKGRGAFATGAFSFEYEFDYPELIGNWDLHGQLDALAPNYLFSFYGSGNETSRGDNPDTDYRMRLNIYDFSVGMRRYQRGLHFISVGPTIQYVIRPDQSTKIFELLPELKDKADFPDRLQAGVNIEYRLENKDDKANPSRGISLSLNARYLNDLIGGLDNFTRISGQLSTYFPVNVLPGKVTLALRAGGAHNIGDFDFYQLNFIGGFKEFRGIRRNRFGGTTSFYGNSDLRFKLFDWYNYVVPIEFGGLIFGDIGRVWAEGEDSDKMHTSFGGGIYVSPWEGIVLSGSYGISDDDEVITVQLGFLF